MSDYLLSKYVGKYLGRCVFELKQSWNDTATGAWKLGHEGEPWSASELVAAVIRGVATC